VSTEQLVAPASWRTLEFISDVHLQAEDPATAQAWTACLAASQADALFILGDLFEVWIGDDALESASPFMSECLSALRGFSARGALFLMHGNRDFLMGAALMQACGARLLPDPTVLVLGQERVLLSHGDALCLDDAQYLQFRQQVRHSQWQQAFLGRPLDERQTIARQLRTQSQAQQAQRQREGRGYAEVDGPAALALLDEHQAQLLIHGHTHRPGRHALAPGRVREVLSDWHAQAHPPRAQVLRLRCGAGTFTLERQELSP
jgi:UDP-2,3-diacylglucosamine hydrolase